MFSITNQMVYNNFLRFSSMYDIWLTIISVVSAVSTGICLPVMIIYFGKVTESFVRIVEYNYSSVHASGNWNLSAQHSQWKQHSSLMEDTIVYSIESGTVGVISLALNAIFVTCLNIAAQNQACRIKSTFFKAVLQQDIAWHDVQSSHDFISQSTENIRKIQDGIGEKLGFMIYYISAFLACIVTALYYGWELTMIIITPLPFLTATTYFLSEQQAKLMIQETNANSEALTTAKEVFESMRTVVAFDGQQKEVERFRQQIQSTGNSVFRRSLMSGLEAGLWWLLTFVSYALAFWYGVTMVLFPSSSLSDDKSEARRKYEVSTFNIVFFSVLYAGSKINQILTLTEIFSSGKVAARSIFQIINRLPIKSTKTGLGECKNIKGQVKFDGIHFSYPSRPTVPVLRDISFNIPDGKLVALVGPSGCGKTTCFQLIQRFYDPNEGQIYLDGVPLKEYDPSWLRRHIGIVEQEPVLFATTIKENIQLGACYDQPGQDETLQEDIQRAASQANAHEFIQSLPLGYDTFIGEGGTRLSGGQKQRIALARVLMGNPKILLLDEPTSSLDALSESAIQQTLDVVCSGRTCFVIAHRMSTIRKADVILVLRDGSIVEAGSHDALIAKRGLYYRLVSASSSDECKSSWHASEQGAGLHMLHQSIHTPDGEREQERSQTALPVGQSSNRHWFAQIINVNRQIIPYIVCGFLAAIVTGLCQPIFAIFFGETLSVLTLKGADSQSEVDLIKTRILVVFLAIAFVAGVAAFAQSFSFSLASSRLSENLQILSYQSMLNQAISWFDRNENSVGALCTRLIDDPANIKAAAGLSMGAVVQALTSLIFSLALAFYYQWKLALVGSIFVPFLLLSAMLDSKVGTAQNSTVDEKNLENSNRVAVEAISNIRTVVGLNKQEYFYKIYKDIQEASTQSKVKQSIIRGLVCGWASNLDTFASIAFMYYGGYLVQHERIGVKNIFTVSESLIYGMEIVGKSFALMPNLSKVFYSADRFCSILKNSNKALSIQSQRWRSSDDTTEVVAEQIRFKNVGFSYPIRPDVSILEGLEVLIQAGQTVALVGPSGSGKTTCIQLLEKLYDPDHGSIYLNGHCLSEMATNSLRHQIGLVGQEPILFNRTIAENIAYGDNTRQPSVEDLIEAARQANIHNWIQSLPLSYDSNVGHRGAQLSGGQKQRVAIARALVRRPRILILDEATSALDSESELLVQQAMSNAQVGRTCIVISHRLHSIRNADRIFVLNQRRVQEQGSHHELMELGGFYSQLYMTENSSEKGGCVSVPDK